jgi:signal transduction histidine kinase/ligand-binding sensor domain-containing protein
MRDGGRQRKSRLIGFVLASVLCCARIAASEDSGAETVRFRNYSTEQGLSQASVLAVAQDKTGFLWIGTQDRLNRFDGYSFKIYRHDRSDSWSLSDSNVVAIASEPDGGMWFGTQSGLNHYDPALDRFTRYHADAAHADALASDHVTALLRDSRNRLWVASDATRLQWFDASTNAFRDMPLGVHSALRGVHAMMERADGSVLLATHEGVWLCDVEAKGMSPWVLPNATSLETNALALASDGTIFVSTAQDGLFEFSADGTVVAHFHHGDAQHDLPDDEIRGIAFDHAQRLWVATKNAGLLRLRDDRENFDVFEHDAARRNSLSAQRQQSVFVDRDGLIWAGSWVNGLSMHDPRTEAFAQIPSSAHALPAQSVTAVLPNDDGTLWFGLSESGGIVRYSTDAGILSRYAHDPKIPGSLPQGLIHHILRTRDGSLWIASSAAGLARLAPGSSNFIHFRHRADDDTSIGGDDVLFLLQDRTGTLWVSLVDGGLDELCAGCSQFKHHRHDPVRADSIGGDTVTAMLETNAGEFWLGQRNEGLERYDRTHDRFEHFRARADDATSLSHNSITAIIEDHAGQLWIGTQGGGIDKLVSDPASPPRFEAITTAHGLAADAIGGIVEDASNQLWLSTTVGISRLDPATKRIVNFGIGDGALAQGYFVSTFAHLRDGRIAFGGLTGATLFDPASVKPPPVPVPIVTDVLLSNAPIGLRWRDPASPIASTPWSGGEVALEPGQDNISFNFSATGFSDPEGVRYSYRLEGHDLHWIEAGASHRYATYTDLPNGDYRLHVRARIDGAPWSTTEASTALHVLPNPWASPKAFIAYVLTGVMIALILGWRMRVEGHRQDLAQEALRTSEERLMYALWGSGGELWDVDLRSGRMLRENRLEHLAATRDATAQTVQDYRPFVHPDDLSHFENKLAAHLRGDDEFFEVSYRTPDDTGLEWRWLLTRGRIVQRDEHGRAMRLVGTTQDISTLKRAEESLRQLNEELESHVETRTADLRRANVELRRTLEQLTQTQRQLLEAEKMAALGGLVAGVAHEINTPLGVTVTAASHLRDEAVRLASLIETNKLTRNELTAFEVIARDSADMILRNLQRADQLIKSFKLVAVDQSSEDRREIELGSYLHEIVTSLGPLLKKRPHRVIVECSESLTMNTYPGALYQIISNLITNSFEHGFDAGRAGEIVIEARRAGNLVLLQYSDNGKGMNPEVRAQVFEPFFTTMRGQGGSGLGMHVVYNLVTQLLKGSIRVESASGAGARFEIFLPIDNPV